MTQRPEYINQETCLITVCVLVMPLNVRGNAFSVSHLPKICMVIEVTGENLKVAIKLFVSNVSCKGFLVVSKASP